jgi:hypothetical protein
MEKVQFTAFLLFASHKMFTRNRFQFWRYPQPSFKDLKRQSEEYDKFIDFIFKSPGRLSTE